MQKQTKFLSQRLEKVEHHVFYEKALAIPGSSISTFFHAFSDYVGTSRQANQSWTDYFAHFVFIDKEKEKICGKNYFSKQQLSELAKLIEKKNLLRYHQVDSKHIEALIQTLKNQKCTLRFEDIFEFTYLELSQEAFATLNEILNLYLPFQGKNERSQITKIKQSLTDLK
jgi:hypothetical protein